MSNQFHPPSSKALKGKVIVLTGGAIGIGACLVRLLHQAQAHVFFGDVLDEPAIALEKELNSDGAMVEFVHCDVTSYAENLALFDAAFQAFGRIDHAISNAGLGEQGNIVSPELTLESVREEPTSNLRAVDVNLKGPIYFGRLASVYLRQSAGGNDDHEGNDKSLTFTSSVAAFREDPGLYVYTASKHGVMGWMRALRSTLSQTTPHAIRTNTVCPWMTRTRMAEGIAQAWDDTGLPGNMPEDVAKILMGVVADSSLTGEAVYVEGGRGWKIEQAKIDLRPQWLGERQTKDLDEGTRALGGGEGWIKGQ
ncbi:hypothetical protein WHR41_01355 [Cladosporium halotolerans]|uniref:3-hydroxyacyl-CoA dehydrogenase n=1 Tax=Cladosporium halotolerans TaxID=1052096 RepID=A0AB34L1E5_9PEZI